MRKIFSTLLATIILTSVSIFNVSAAEATVSLENKFIEASATDDTTVDIAVNLNGCEGFANLGLEVSYDSSVMTLAKVTRNTDVPATYVASQYLTVNPYVMTWNDVSNVNFNGTLATLSFTVPKNTPPGTYPITISYQKGINGNYQDNVNVNYDELFEGLNLSYVNGSITVKSEPTAVNTVLEKFIGKSDGSEATAVLSEISTNGNSISSVKWQINNLGAEFNDSMVISGQSKVCFGLVIPFSLTAETGTVTDEIITTIN